MFSPRIGDTAAVEVLAQGFREALKLQNRAIARFGGSNTPYHPTSAYRGTSELEANCERIVRELEQLLELGHLIPSFEQVSSRQKRLGERWQTFFLKVHGHTGESAASLCPVTTGLVRNDATVENAMFSILQPHKRIPAHRGPNKAVLRYHLGLVVPSVDPDVCGIEVGGQRRGWEVGKSLMFDDTYEHSAWNDTSELRTVLFMDIRRELPLLLKPVVQAMTGFGMRRHPDVAEIRRNSDDYATKLLEARKRPRR